jgi:hypothetical protein
LDIGKIGNKAIAGCFLLKGDRCFFGEVIVIVGVERGDRCVIFCGEAIAVCFFEW